MQPIITLSGNITCTKLQNYILSTRKKLRTTDNCLIWREIDTLGAIVQRGTNTQIHISRAVARVQKRANTQEGHAQVRDCVPGEEIVVNIQIKILAETVVHFF